MWRGGVSARQTPGLPGQTGVSGRGECMMGLDALGTSLGVLPRADTAYSIWPPKLSLVIAESDLLL